MMTKQEKENWKVIWFYMIKGTWNILVGIGTVFSILGISISGLISKHSSIPSNKMMIICLGIIIVCLLLFIIRFIIVVHKFLCNNINEKEIDLPNEIYKMVQYLYDKQKYNDVVRLGSTISRFMWLNHYYQQRIEIGKLVEDSASKTQNIREQVSALIDDIGWTYFETGDSKNAIKNINNGIQKAITNNLFYYAAKGERHLAGIVSKNDRDGILNHLTKAEELTENITDILKKDEMMGSLAFSKAKYYFDDKKYKDAEDKLLEARAFFKNDSDRIVKTHSLLGKIYFMQNTDESIQKAKDEFNNGYTKSKNVRQDEFAKNALGLAEIEIRELDFKNAEKYFVEAKEILGTSNEEIKKVSNLLKKVKQNGNQ